MNTVPARIIDHLQTAIRRELLNRPFYERGEGTFKRPPRPIPAAIWSAVRFGMPLREVRELFLVLLVREKLDEETMSDLHDEYFRYQL